MCRVVLAAMLIVLALSAPQALGQIATNVSLVATPPTSGSPNVELFGPVGVLPAKERTNVLLEAANLGPGAMRNVSALVQPATPGLTVVGELTRDLDDLAPGDSAPIFVRVATPDVAGSDSHHRLPRDNFP